MLPGGSGALCAREMTMTPSSCPFWELTLMTQNTHRLLTSTAVPSAGLLCKAPRMGSGFGGLGRTSISPWLPEALILVLVILSVLW